ncbi:hypothetical protein OV320_7849 [Actinobacteria bacterium OV320]|jgi:hypothetical protein|nr:hypothetical protein OV320_7849 [Actinobacteria bacterium OV320]
MAVNELIQIAGGDVAFYETCNQVAKNVHSKWESISPDDLTQMIAIKTMENAPTLVKNLRTADDPLTYLGRSMYKAGVLGASTEVYGRKVGGFSAASDDNPDWYEEASYGTPEGIYSTEAIRAALQALDWSDQNDPLMVLVEDGLLKLSDRDREIIIDFFVNGEKPAYRVHVTRAVDRLTKFVNGWA